MTYQVSTPHLIIQYFKLKNLHTISVKNPNEFPLGKLCLPNYHRQFNSNKFSKGETGEWRLKYVRAHSRTNQTRLEHVPVAEELGEGAVRDAELGEEAHRVDGVTSAAGALRPLPLLPRSGWAVGRRRGGGR